MNKIITEFVESHGRLIPISELRPNSNLRVEVECEHGRRMVRWYRRDQLCGRCAVKKGLRLTTQKGRKITWGDKISKAKKGKKFSEEHKKALVAVRKQKYCDRMGISLDEFKDFISYRKKRFSINKVINRMLKSNWNVDKLILSNREKDFFNKVGYSILNLKNHLENQFIDGQSWDNYGHKGWHIDHKTPFSWFNMDDEQQFCQCWSLSNLQPLWAHQNLSKNNHRADY